MEEKVVRKNKVFSTLAKVIIILSVVVGLGWGGVVEACSPGPYPFSVNWSCGNSHN